MEAAFDQVLYDLVAKRVRRPVTRDQLLDQLAAAFPVVRHSTRSESLISPHRRRCVGRARFWAHVPRHPPLAAM
jgi:hypothetical protein